MPDQEKTLGGSLVLDLRIWWHHVHTLYWVKFLCLKCTPTVCTCTSNNWQIFLGYEFETEALTSIISSNADFLLTLKNSRVSLE